MGSVLEPLGSPERPDGYLPRSGPPDRVCESRSAWTALEYPNIPQIRTAPREGETEADADARIRAEVAAMARRPYVTGTHDANDALWGYCHIWLADGTVVKFWQATGRWDGKWRWEAGSKSGLADSIEAGREAAAKALGVSFEMSPERFTKIMGWDRAPTPREPAP